MYVDWRLLGSVHGFPQGHCPVKKSKAVISEQPQPRQTPVMLVTWCRIYSYPCPPWLQRSSYRSPNFLPASSAHPCCPFFPPLPLTSLPPQHRYHSFQEASLILKMFFLRFCPWDGIPRLQDISSESSLGTDPLPCLTMWPLAGWMGSHLVITPNSIWHCNSF